MLPEKWTGRLVGKMHCNRVTYGELAEELGVTKTYVSLILNGHRNPPNIQERMENAFAAVLEKRKV